jgi:acyl homoserine lactone synthase
MSQILMAGGGQPGFDPVTLVHMFAFRHRIFHDRLGWDVTSDHGLEYDHFDRLDPVYLLARDEQLQVEGCWRILPTTGPYMLRDTFPQLLGDTPAPCAADVWELSRFAVEPGDGGCSQARLNQVALDLMRRAYEFAMEHRIRHYVTVTSVALERLMKAGGVPLVRLGDGRAQRIGKVLTVACWIAIDEPLRQALFPVRETTGARHAA